MRALVLAAVLALGTAAPAAAHRGHAVLTVVEIDAATGVTTITHRMAAHDVEPALPTIAPDAQPSLDDPEAMRALQAYVAEAFKLADDVGPANLDVRGYVADGDDLTLRYGTTLDPATTRLTLDSDLFEAVHADMENQVNVRVNGGPTRTLVFRPGDAPQTLPLRPE